jgi:hypothetical protein
MPIALFLNEEQLDVFNNALKGKEITFKTIGRTNIQLTAENWEAIREALLELHNKKFSIRTKTIEHLETCYYAEQILSKITTLEGDLKELPPVNDNTIGTVTIPSDEEMGIPTTDEEKAALTKEVLDGVETGKTVINKGRANGGNRNRN